MEELTTKLPQLPAQSLAPRLLETGYWGFDIIEFGSKIYALGQGQGAFDVQKFEHHEYERCFVAETFRMKGGVTDNRDHKWLDDDLACRTVEDRVAMYRKDAKDKFAQAQRAFDLGQNQNPRNMDRARANVEAVKEQIRLLNDEWTKE